MIKKIDHISFSVEDIEKTVTQIKKNGYDFLLEPMQIEGGAKLASFNGHDGVMIELIEHPL